MEEPLQTHLLLLGDLAIDRGRSLAEGFGRAIDGRLVIHSSALGASEATAQARELIVAQPLGVLASDESECLDAIAAGADDARVVTGLDSVAFAAFFDRVQLRARVRADRERRAEALAHNEKLTALGTLVAGIGHEINNPLTAISLSIEAARRIVVPLLETAHEIDREASTSNGVDYATLRRWQEAVRIGSRRRDAAMLFEDISQATTHISSIVADLRVFARTEVREPPSLVDLRDLVDQAARLVGREIALAGTIEYDFVQEIPRLVLPSNRVVQVLTNLLVNAAHAIRELPRERHRVRIGVRVDEDFVALSVSDTGPGVPAASLERIFDPFYTTKREELGTGLGLSISRAILRELGGDLVVESVYGEGATFLCLLPRPAAGMQLPYVRSSAPVPTARARRELSVLVVDEDERVLRSASRALASRYRVCLARDADEALALLHSGTHADVIVAESEPLDCGARALLEALAKARHRLAERMIFTRARHDGRSDVAIAGIVPAYVDKPLRAEALCEAIEAVAQAAITVPTSDPPPPARYLG